MRKLLILLLLILSSNAIFSQDIEPKQNDTTIIDIDSDILEASPEIGEGIQRLIGNVVMTHDSVVMTCDTAFFNRDENSFLGKGNIHLNQGDTIDIWAKTLQYDGNIKIGKFRNEVIMQKDSMTLKTDSLDFDLNTNTGYYEYGAISGNEKDTLISKIGIFDSNRDEFRFRTNVEVRSPKQIIYSDTLNYNTQTKVSSFLGPTEILGDSNYIYCENGWYNHEREIAQFNKNAFLNNGNNTLKGDSLYYNRTEAYGESFKNVTLIDTAQNMIISGRYGIYLEKTQFSFVTDSALLKHIIDSDTLYLHADTLITIADTAFYRSDSTHILTNISIIEKDSTIILRDTIFNQMDSILALNDSIIQFTDTIINTRDSLFSFTDTLIITRDSIVTTLDSSRIFKYVRAYNKVKMFKSDFQIKSDSLSYSTLDSTFRIYENPILWSDSMQVTADSIFIFTKNNKPERMDILGAAFLIMQESSTEYNQAKGDNIFCFFKEEELRKIDVKENAKSIFYVIDNNELVGINTAESTDMQILRANGEIEFIKWFKQIKGAMYPEDKITDSQKLFEDFNWRESEKPKKWQDIFIWEEVVEIKSETEEESVGGIKNNEMKNKKTRNKNKD